MTARPRRANPSSRRVLVLLLDRFGEWLREFHRVPPSERGGDFVSQRRHRHEGIGLMRKR